MTSNLTSEAALVPRHGYNLAVSDAPGLTLDEFAKITVWLRAGTKRERALAEAEIDTATWLSAQIYWLGRMASLVASGDSGLHNRFLALTAELERDGVGKLPPLALVDRSSPAPRLAPLRTKSVLDEGPKVSVEASPLPSSPAPAPPPSVPDVIMVPAAAPKGGRFHTMAGASPWGPDPESAVSLPFKTAAPKPSGAVAEQAQAEALRPSLPFGKQPTSTGGPASIPSDPVERSVAKGGVVALRENPLAQTVDAASIVAAMQALPFAASSRAPVAREGEALARGSTVGFAAPPMARATPFDPAFDNSAAGDAEAVDVNAQTAEDTINPVSPALPFDRAAPAPTAGLAVGPSSHVPQLSVENYASLCATCEVYPGRVSSVYEQYGARTPEERAALDTLWRENMQKDILLHGRFQRLLAEYRGWLERQRG